MEKYEAIKKDQRNYFCFHLNELQGLLLSELSIAPNNMSNILLFV